MGPPDCVYEDRFLGIFQSTSLTVAWKLIHRYIDPRKFEKSSNARLSKLYISFNNRIWDKSIIYFSIWNNVLDFFQYKVNNKNVILEHYSIL